MKGKAVLTVLLAGTGVAALVAVNGPADSGVATAEARVVQAPTMASAPPTTAGPMPQHDGMTGAGVPERGPAVGVTLVGGKPFLLTAENPAAIRLAATAAGPAERAFSCGLPAAEPDGATQEATPRFAAWPLVSSTGKGERLSASPDGRLFSVPAGAGRVACTVSTAPGK